MSEYVVQLNGFTYVIRADSMNDALLQFVRQNQHPFATQVLITKRA